MPKAKAKHAGGRPTKYLPEYAKLAAKACAAGATTAQLADFFEVSISTICLWRLVHPEFSEALRDWKAVADAQVERSLYERACGYSHDETDIRVVGGVIVATPIRKVYPPDPTSMIFWLKNRQPDKWRDKPEPDDTLKRAAMRILGLDDPEPESGGAEPASDNPAT